MVNKFHFDLNLLFFLQKRRATMQLLRIKANEKQVLLKRVESILLVFPSYLLQGRQSYGYFYFQIRKFSLQIFVMVFEVNAHKFLTIDWKLLRRVSSKKNQKLI